MTIDQQTAQMLADGLEVAADKLEKVISIYELDNGKTETASNRIMALVMLKEFADTQIVELSKYVTSDTFNILTMLSNDFVKENLITVFKVNQGEKKP